ncbi:MAG TPA: gamma-glutamyltransferase family protein [Casimicrobiaceae bacterium]|nr:gamma-glutamyltransferase family protein [Casimicrobiaceae bacterium]
MTDALMRETLAPAAALPTGFDWSLPYPSRRQPIFARNVVATSQPLAAQAGLAMLRAGGNAIDAALAAAITLTVVEPCSNGLGSDLFALVWRDGELFGLNASGRAPAAWTPERYAEQDAMPRTGWDTVTIPGAVSGWVALSQRFGKLPFADLFVPAIAYASDGFAVSPVVAEKWTNAVPVLGRVPGFAEHFLPRGRALAVGEIFSSAALAGTLAKIAASGGETFYRGELAEAMVAHSRAHRGAHTFDDFAAHRCDWVTPLACDYRGYTVHEIPPNGQGIAALMALGILENFDLAALTVDSVEVQHLEIEAMKLAFADVYRYVGDPRTMRVTPAQLLDRGYLASRARLIDRARAQHFAYGTPPPGGTVYLAAADQAGTIVSLIQSNYMGFGSGIVVPGTGISLQNRGTGFSLEPGHANLVGGGKRPFHTIIPGFVARGGSPYAAFGVMGGPIQPQAHLQTLVRLIDYRSNPQAVLDAPRWKVNGGVSIDLEAGASPRLREGLRAVGHSFASISDSYMDFGAGQFVVRGEHGYIAGSDPRRDGQAAGY